jgi:hypothetical protein
VVFVFVSALLVRVAFTAAIGRTYDFDEFVLLLLGRDYAHGATPYGGFMFFHPPGVLLLLRAIEPLTSLWWPIARVLTAVVDALTCAAVYRIALKTFDRRTGITAAVLYGTSPLALVSAARFGQDPLIAFLVVLGVLLLVERQGTWAAVAAGCCLALATWVKYPAAAFLPAYLLLAWRRAPALLAGGAAAGAVLLAPFLPEIDPLIRQTVRFQSHRWKMHVDIRLFTAAIWWLGVSPLAPLSLAARRPLWLRIGFLTGAVFLVASQVYYHYFVPVAPFAAILGAPLAVQLTRVVYARIAAVIALAVLVAGWAIWLNVGGPSPLYVTAAHLSGVQPAVHLLRRTVPTRGAVLGDQLEYAYLANRPALDDYFWNIGVLVNARYLEKRVPRAQAVVLSYGASSGYPRGFVAWLDRQYRRQNVGAATVWETRDKK